MGLFEDGFTEEPTEKKEIYANMLNTQPSSILEDFLKFEDLIIGGYVNAFPDKIAYRWESVQAIKEKEHNKDTGL